MRSMPRLVGAVELLDSPRHDPAELEHSLRQVAAVNRWLGGAFAMRVRLPEVLPRTPTATILDVGTGAGDLAAGLTDPLPGRPRLWVTAVDVHPQVVRIARRRLGDHPEVAIGAANALALPFADRSFDAVLLSLVLHHFERDRQIAALREAARVARVGVLVGELERCRAAWIGSRLLAATVWRRNRLTRHDGPLSVRRAFTPNELTSLGHAAGLADVHTTRHPVYRLVLTGRVRAQ